MFDAKILDGITSRLPSGLQHTKADLEKSFRTNLKLAISKMDLVTREEFDVQSAVLLRTREKLEVLEKQVAALEQQLVDKT